jgi:large repetitive protein
MKANAFRLRIAVVVLAVLFTAAPLRAQCTVTCTATVPSTGTAGVAADFESTASPCLCGGSPSYFWDFGDGTDSTDPSPSHAYASNGTYAWELTVTADAATCTKAGSITIGPVTPGAGTYSGTTSLGHAFSLTVNGSSQITSWSVAFSGLCGSTGSANGSTCSITNGSVSCGSASCIPFSTQASISGTFSSETGVGGNATLKGMPDPINCCTQTPSFSANLSPGPLTASASPDVSSGNAPLTVNFTGSASGGTAPYSYSWDFGDCSAASSTQNPSHVYPAGNWNAVLTVTDSASGTADAVVPIGATALPGITVDPTSGLSTNELGSVDSFDVVLNTQPAADVTIEIATADATEGLIGPDAFTGQTSMTVTFTAGDWDTPQTVYVHGQDDNLQDGDVTFNIVTAPAESTDPNYGGIDPADVSVTNEDVVATAGVEVTPANVTVSESGTTDAFSVVLESEPTGNVIIEVTSTDTAEATVSPAQLTFTPANYATPQDVTVTGIDDAIEDGDQVTDIEVTMNAATADPVYAGIEPGDVTATTTDDEVMVIVSTNPAPNARAAPRSADVQATASAGVNAATVSQATFRVQGDQTGRIAGAYSTSTATFELNPANDFKPGETIKVTATSAIEGTAGHPLVPRVWQFTAAAGAGTGAMLAHPVAPRFGPDGARDAVIADLDADGVLDVLIASETALETWLGDGSGLFSLSATLSEHEGGDVPTIAVADLDGDGDLDAVMAKWLTQGKIFINDGTGTFTSHAFASGGDYSYDLALGDVDGDGDLDAVVTTGGSNQADRVYLNDGAGVFSPHAVTPSFGASVGKDIALGDLDGDGDLDAVVATEQQGEETWLNDGTGSFSPHPGTPTFGIGEYSEGVALGDLDGDGDLDAVFANATPLPETVWLNDGTGAFSAHPTTPQFGAGFSSDVALGDLDGDGDLDAVIGEYSQEGQSSVWVNDGDGDFAPHPVIPLFDHGQRYGGVILGELDGDGDLDAIGVGGFSGSPQQTVWLNTEISVSPVSGVVTTEGGGTATFNVMLNRQPSDDVTIPISTSDSSEGRISSGGATQQTALNLTFTSANWNVARTITVHGQGDALIDGDIAYTLVVGAATSSDPFFSGVDPADVSASNTDDDAAGVTVSTNAVSVSERGTSATFTVVLTSEPAGDVAIDLSSSDTGEATVSPAQLTFNSGNWSTPRTVTVTGVADALADGDQNTTINVAMNTGVTTDPLYDAVDPTDVTAMTVDDLVAIVDSDPGANEASASRTTNITATASHPIDAATVTQSTFRVQGDQTGRIGGAYSGAAETFMLDPAAALKPGETIRVTATAGIESIGAIDIRPHVWQFTAATAASTGAMVPDPANPSFAAGDLGVALADLDSDGDLDALFISNGNYDTTWLNDGTGALTLHASFGNVSASKIGVALGDLDGDGDLDAVITARFEDETVWLNDGAANFSLHTTFEANWTTRVALGDLDGDGDLDAVMGHEDAGGTTWLNDGSATFTAHPTTPAFGSGGPHDIVLGDIDGDGDLDAVMPGYNGAERVWRNDGMGSFSAGPSFGSGDNTWTLGLGDLDGDGDLDALTANMIDQAERVWLNDGTGTFSAHPTIPLFGAGNSRAVLLGDLDGDGDPDAIIPDALGGAEPVWMNDGTGGFSAHPSVPALAAGDSWGGALGDLDGDGDLDAVISNAGNPRQDETVWLNEPVAFSQTSGIATTEAGGTGTFSVVLGREPSADVSFELTSSDTTEGRLSTDGSTEQNAVTLTFTASNWSTPQVVTVHGQDDVASDGDTAYTIVTGAVTSSDPFYSGVNPLDVAGMNSDDDPAGVTLSTNAVSVSESGTSATFTVALDTEPAGDVVLDVSSLDTGEATVSPSQLTFTPANWSAPQTVTVTGVDDAVDDGSQISTIVLTVNAALTADGAYDAIDPAGVTVTTTDNDKTPSTTTLTSSVNPSTSGESVTFTAAVTSGATGTVTFNNGVTALGTVALASGSASLAVANLAAGSHSITATYNGNASFTSSTSNTVTQTVNASAFGAPPFFNATAATATRVALTWGAVSGATSYEIHRTATLSSPYALVHTTSATSYTNTGLTANTTYLYKVRTIGGSGPSPFSAVDIATTVIFTDPAPTTATKIKAIHITQLRTAVNSVRTAAGLPAATFTDPTLTAFSTKLEAAHISELRTALNAARSTLALSAITYTDPTLTAGSTKAKLAHVTQLRTGVQ